MFNVKLMYMCLGVVFFPNCRIDSVNDTAISLLIDVRDGQEYKVRTMKDGNLWMAENLNYNIENSWCYNDSSVLCSKFGRLYNLASASKSCPPSWRLPSEEEWRTMAEYYKISSNDSLALESQPNLNSPFWTFKEMNIIYKNLTSNNFVKGNGGVREAYGAFINFEITEQFWTKTPKGKSLQYNYEFYYSRNELRSRFSRGFKNVESGLYCRCIKEQ